MFVRCLFLIVPRTGREAWPESVGPVKSMNYVDVAPEVVDAQDRVTAASWSGVGPCCTQRGVWVHVKQQSNFVGLW